MLRATWRQWAALVAGASIVLTACGNGDTANGGDPSPPTATETDAPTEEPADVSGTLTWYTLYATETTEPYIAAFNERYPNVTVETLQFGSAEMIERVQAEFQSGVHAVDIMNIVIGLFADPLVDAGIIMEYTPSSLADYPADLRDTIHSGHYTAMGVNPHAICVNTEAVEDIPTSYEDLVDPQYHRLISLQTFLSAGGSRNFMVEMEGYWGNEKWDEWMRGLAANDPIFHEDPRGAMDLLERGEAGVDPYCNATLFLAARERGAPVEWIPVNPNIASFINVMAAENAPNPEAARAFLDWTFSPEGQSFVGSAIGLQPVHPDAEFPDYLQGMMDVDLVSSPSEFQLMKLDGAGMRDPDALQEYADYAREVFNLR